jgi:hypothetical protein
MLQCTRDSELRLSDVGESQCCLPEVAWTQRLQALAWWDCNHETLHRALRDFRSLSVEAFFEHYEEKRPRLARIAG